MEIHTTNDALLALRAGGEGRGEPHRRVPPTPAVGTDPPPPPSAEVGGQEGR